MNQANKNEYTLKQFFGLVFEDLVAEDYELKVILPEGATEIKVKFLKTQWKKIQFKNNEKMHKSRFYRSMWMTNTPLLHTPT